MATQHVPAASSRTQWHQRTEPRLGTALGRAVLIPAILGGMAFMSAPANAGPNLVKNGDFESSTGAGSYGVTQGITGLGQVNNADTTNYVQIGGLPSLGGGGWNVSCLRDCGAGSTDNQGYLYLLNANADTTGANAGFPYYAQNTIKIMNLWGPNISYPTGWPAGTRYVAPSANPPNLGSPSGGKFLAIDGVYGRSKITQQITGLDITKSYTLSFEYAGGQQYSRNEYSSDPSNTYGRYTGDTDQTWIVRGSGGFSQFSLGSQSCGGGTLTCWMNPTQSFTPWQTYTKTFTPTSSTLNLEFEAWGTRSGDSTPGGDNPPFLLLDNVQLVEAGGPSSDPAPAPLPVLGGGVAFALARRLRRRVSGARIRGSSTGTI